MTKQDYAAAIIKLVPLAQGDTGGSRVAAQVLLSAYNGKMIFSWTLLTYVALIVGTIKPLSR